MKRFFLYTSLLLSNPLLPVTLVYNLRIAETTRRHELVERFGKTFIAAATGVKQLRETYYNSKQGVGGVIGTFSHALGKQGFVRVDAAGGHVKETFQNCTTFSRAQWDDVLFTAGYGGKVCDDLKITASGMFGLPTHRDFAFEGIQLGTGHMGLGAQIDTAWRYGHNHVLFGAARFVHFLPRMVDITFNNQTRSFNFFLGNVIDLLVSHRSRWGRHSLEVGYNPTFGFGAHLVPALESTQLSSVFIRNSIFIAYVCGLLLRKTYPSAFIFGFSTGGDARPKTIGIKRGLTVWASWGLNF